MFAFLLFLSCTYVTSFAFSSPYTGSHVRRQTDLEETESDSADNGAQVINATVMDLKGNDITSGFDVMVFYDTSIAMNDTAQVNDTTPASNSTDKPLGRRSPGFYRPITYCSVPRTTFVSSECTPSDNKVGSLQAYTIHCYRTQDIYHPYTAKFLYTSTFPVQRGGHCMRDEICVNGGNPSDGPFRNSPGVRFAYCVQRRVFQKMSSTSPLGLKLNKQSLLRDLEGKRLSMVVSKPDQVTPLEVDQFDVEAEVAGSGEKDDPLTDSCRDCMELETQQFKQGTESLKAEATLLTTGAVAGVLWLAIMSG